jgi:Protein of unknown function (DUF3300)
MKLIRSLIALLAGMLLSVPLVVSAQGPPPQPLPQDQLDALLAPIALYPDELLTQVLMASTYPLEVVEAARFVKANPTLRGPALDDALKDRTWDPSVLSLAPFPQVLDMMNDKLEWTQRLGDAFLADEAAVMRTVQMLRQRAQQAGNLQSNEQQRVFVQDRYIVIEPAQPQYVYVPVYNPTIIYGPWWAPAYRPWYWYPPPIWGYPPAPPAWGFTAGFFWGSAWAVHRSYWGWARPNWSSNNVHINVNVNNNYWASRPQYRERYPNGSGNWTHVPEHRKGVAYRDTATRDKYRPTNPTAVQTRESYRGNTARPSTLPAGTTGSPTSRPMPTTPAVAQPGTRPASPALAQPSTQPASPALAQPSVRPSSPTVDPSRPSQSRERTSRTPQGQSTSQGAPTFQTQARPQVQTESNRGQASRQQMNQPSDANRGQAGRQQMNQPSDANRGQAGRQQTNQPRPEKQQGNPGDGGSPQGKSR